MIHSGWSGLLPLLMLSHFSSAAGTGRSAMNTMKMLMKSPRILRHFLYNRHWYWRPFRLLRRLFRVNHPLPLAVRMISWPAVAVSNFVTNCLFAIDWRFDHVHKQFDDADIRVTRNKLLTSKPAPKTSALHFLASEF